MDGARGTSATATPTPAQGATLGDLEKLRDELIDVAEETRITRAVAFALLQAMESVLGDDEVEVVAIGRAAAKKYLATARDHLEEAYNQQRAARNSAEQGVFVSTNLTVREACRRRMPLDGADAQALEYALVITERERDKAISERDIAHGGLEKAEAQFETARKRMAQGGAVIAHARAFECAKKALVAAVETGDPESAVERVEQVRRRSLRLTDSVADYNAAVAADEMVP